MTWSWRRWEVVDCGNTLELRWTYLLMDLDVSWEQEKKHVVTWVQTSLSIYCPGQLVGRNSFGDTDQEFGVDMPPLWCFLHIRWCPKLSSPVDQELPGKAGCLDSGVISRSRRRHQGSEKRPKVLQHSCLEKACLLRRVQRGGRETRRLWWR